MRNNVVQVGGSLQNHKNIINKTNLVYFTLLPVICVFTTYYWFKSDSFNWPTIILGLILATFVELSITAGYHRLFAHRSYQAKWPVRLFFLVFGAAALQGSAIQWALDHRDHHNYVDDNDRDPYSIGKGFWWAHMGWLFYKQNYQLKQLPEAGDLRNDPLVMLQFKTWIPFGFFVGYILPGIIALAWHDWFGGFFIAGCLRSVLNHHATFLINSLSHCVGRQTYSDSHSARDNWFTAFLTFGEGYHNYHHEFPSDYRNGVRAWDWDPTNWVSRGLAFFGLTGRLKRISHEIIVRKRLEMKAKRLHKKIANYKSLLASKDLRMIDKLTLQVESTFRHLSNLREEHKDLLKAFDADNLPKFEVGEIKEKILEAQQQFFRSVDLWNGMSRRVLKLAYAKA